MLEIGTFSGHSALSMAAALPEGGRIDACELDPERAAVAQRFFDRSPHGSKITLHIGPALETVRGLEGEFDFVFIDAEKEGYVGYYEEVLPRLSERGLIVADNTLGGGRVVDEQPPIAAFNEHVAADPRSVQVLAQRARRHDADPPCVAPRRSHCSHSLSPVAQGAAVCALDRRVPARPGREALQVGDVPALLTEPGCRDAGPASCSSTTRART